MSALPQQNSILLDEVASARSGDKGNHSNIGIVARDRACFEFLRQHLTPEIIQHHFRALGVARVERFELPNVEAFNFLLYDALAGGASESMRLDTQGKLLGQQVLLLALPTTEAELRTLNLKPFVFDKQVVV